MEADPDNTCVDFEICEPECGAASKSFSTLTTASPVVSDDGMLHFRSLHRYVRDPGDVGIIQRDGQRNRRKGTYFSMQNSSRIDAPILRPSGAEFTY